MKMKNIRILSFLMMILILFTASASSASPRFFIKMDGIQGECRDPGHVRWIEALSFSHTARSANESDPLNGDPTAGYYLFTHPVDMAVPSIQAACMKRTLIPTCICEVCKEENGKIVPKYRVIMNNVIVKSAEIEQVHSPDSKYPLIEKVRMSVEKVSFVDLNQEDDDPETPKTGDTAPLMLWVLLAAGSCAAIFLILKRKAHS